MGKRLDLSGQRFGKLTVVNRVANIGSRTAWRCICACGQECIALTKNLRSGKTTHCNNCKSKNGIENLHYIDGTCIEMLQSSTIRKNNKSGHTGVFYDSTKCKWRAEIMLQGKRRCLGRFNSLTDAVKAREKAKDLLHNAFIEEHINQ